MEIAAKGVDLLLGAGIVGVGDAEGVEGTLGDARGHRPAWRNTDYSHARHHRMVL